MIEIHVKVRGSTNGISNKYSINSYYSIWKPLITQFGNHTRRRFQSDDLSLIAHYKLLTLSHPKKKISARHRLAIFIVVALRLLESVRWSRHLVIHWRLLGNLMYWFCQRSRVRDWLWLGKVLAPLTHPTWDKLLCGLDVI